MYNAISPKILKFTKNLFFGKTVGFLDITVNWELKKKLNVIIIIIF